MKKSILILFTILSVGFARAQQSDTTKADPPKTVEDQPTEAVQVDSTKLTNPTVGPQENVIPGRTEIDPQESNEPKIIYYQTTPDESYERRDYTYRSSTRKRDDIKTLAGSMHHSGGFGALSFRTTRFNQEAMVMAGVRAGWIINRTVGIGVEGHGIIPTTKYDGIDLTQDVFAVGGYGGMFMELIFFSNTVIHVTFPTSAGAGWIGYNEDWENPNPRPPGNTEYSTLIDDDVFWYVEPGANIEVNVSRNFRLDFGFSKRFTQDFELLNTSARAFENTNFYVTLKIGGF